IADTALIHTPQAFASEHSPSSAGSAPPGAASVSDIRVEPRGGLGWLLFAVAIVAFVFAASSVQAWQEVGVSKGRWFTFDDAADSKAANANAHPEPAVATGPPSGKLTVSASGSGCPVNVDGKPVGHAPIVDFVLSSGLHLIECTPAAGRAF